MSSSKQGWQLVAIVLRDLSCNDFDGVGGYLTAEEKTKFRLAFRITTPTLPCSTPSLKMSHARAYIADALDLLRSAKPKLRKKKVANERLDALTVAVVAVAGGVRMGALVDDQFPLEVMHDVSALAQVCGQFGASVLQVGMDALFIVNRFMLAKRFSALSRGEVFDLDVCVIQVSDAEAHFDPGDTLRSALKLMLEQLGGIEGILVHMNPGEHRCVLKDAGHELVAVAGWLLGYPAIYTQRSMGVSGCLSGSPLHLYTIQLQGPNLSQTLESWSIPQSLATRALQTQINRHQRLLVHRWSRLDSTFVAQALCTDVIIPHVAL